MRALLLLPIAILVTIALIFALTFVTGDMLGAVFLSLMLLVSVGAWLAAPIAAAGECAPPSENSHP